MVRMCSAQYLKRTHKFGLKLPKTINDTYVIDQKNRNTLWQDAIQKEMENVKIAFQIIPDGKKPPNGFQYVNCHMVFDIKMEDLQRKALLAVGGHMTHTLDAITYSSVVTRESVHIMLAMVALHDLEVRAADLLNAYVMAPNHDKIWTVLGPELGDNAGKSAIIVRVLYGLKSAGALFRAYLAQCMW